MINGIITNKEVWANAGLIIKEFGLVVFVRLLWVAISDKQTTFLEEVMK